jgi:hypothetical protein
VLSVLYVPPFLRSQSPYLYYIVCRSVTHLCLISKYVFVMTTKFSSASHSSLCLYCTFVVINTDNYSKLKHNCMSIILCIKFLHISLV